jgi:hypothetical protein
MVPEPDNAGQIRLESLTYKGTFRMISICLTVAVALAAASVPDPLPSTPGSAYAPPDYPQAPGTPLIYSHSADAGVDESFVLVGEGFTNELKAWGIHPNAASGREIKLKVQISTPGLVVATVPETAYEGPIVVWAKNKGGYSEPVVINAPELWWYSSESAEAGREVSLFGRNLCQRPDFSRGLVYLAQAGKPGIWLKVTEGGKYRLGVLLPTEIEPGKYQVWVYAGNGGKYGWGGPLPLEVRPPQSKPGRVVHFDGGNLQEAVDRLAADGGGTVRIPEGNFNLASTLVIPAKVQVAGAGIDRTVLLSPSDPTAPLVSASGLDWNRFPDGVHSRGDEMSYKVQFPATGRWTVWLRYGTDMAPYGGSGVSKRMTIAIDGGNPVVLDNLPNTGGFATLKWSRSASVQVAAGMHEIVWRNVEGGGISLDAFVFALDPAYVPGDNPFPSDGPQTVVVQGEDVLRFQSADGSLPQVDRPVAWLCGDGASLSNLTLRGNPRTNAGIVVHSRQRLGRVRDCRVTNVKVCGCEGKRWDNTGIHLCDAEGANVQYNELWGMTPIYLSGVEGCRLVGNRLVGQTLRGGNSEAYILSAQSRVRKCIIEGNVCACPPGVEAGGPTGRRMLWFSTGRGSVDRNWIAGNREDKARFGGVAATDQNVGETILFEGCERIAYHGPLAAAGSQSVTLPATLPTTPDDRLGTVQREQLAHDATGKETPFWPPDVDQGGPEAPLGEYFATILRGRGLGQTRQVVGRKGETYLLDRPWRVAPQAGSLVLVHTAFWRNHLVGNRTVDGMTGVQLWIACIENILSGNQVERMRKPGLYLYGNCTTLASSMPASWNSGIGPLYFNHVEGSQCDETSCGAIVISEERPGLPVDFPRCLGNVLRHNSFTRSRTDGLLVTGGREAKDRQPAAVIQATIAEFNVARDAAVCYHVAPAADATLLRRNHAYSWNPVPYQTWPRVGFQVDDDKATAVIELNTTEGLDGTWNETQLIPELRGGKRPPSTRW